MSYSGQDRAGQQQRQRGGRWAVALAAAAAVAVAPAGLFGSELSEDLAARRAKLMARFGPDAMIVLLSAPSRNYSLDVDYEYRQDSSLYYLTGLSQPDTTLVLMPGNTEHREILFLSGRDPQREHWSGRLLSVHEASERSGIETVLSASQFEPFLAAMLRRAPMEPVDDRQAAAFFSAVAANRAELALAIEPVGLGAPLSGPLDLARRVRDRFPAIRIVDAWWALADQRLVKSPYERRLLTRSLEISSEAQLAGMRVAKPGAFEYQVKAAVEAVHRARGAVSSSFPSIVGSGPNATILHTPHSDRQMQAGDLILVDAASSYEYLAGDVTRTYPVSGRFTPPQREIYALVLQAQEQAIEVAKPGSSLRDIHDRAVEVLKAGLLKLGLITDAGGEQYRMWFTHGTTHYLGLDVHDVGDLRRPLEPGMAFVIEPGLYIRQAALDVLPRTPEHVALIEKVQPAVSRYLDIGIRIEDAFLLDESGLRHLTADVPRTIDAIESFLRSRP